MKLTLLTAATLVASTPTTTMGLVATSTTSTTTTSAASFTKTTTAALSMTSTGSIADDLDIIPPDPVQRCRKMSTSIPFVQCPPVLHNSDLAGNVGFDPLNFSKNKELLWEYREAEIKHARLAMLVSTDSISLFSWMYRRHVATDYGSLLFVSLSLSYYILINNYDV
jgi:hypothetical protein